jgi:hypothetical protein
MLRDDVSSQKIRSTNGMQHRYWTVVENERIAAKA